MPRTIRAAAILAAFIAGALIPACSNQDDAPAAVRPTTTAAATTSAPDPAPTTTTPTPPPTPEDEVSAAYVAIIQSSYNRLRNPDPNDPTIETEHVGASLERTLANNRDALLSGKRYRFTDLGPPRVLVRLVELKSPDLAVIESCVSDDVIVFDINSGKILDDSVDVAEMRGELIRVDTTWKLSSNEIVRRLPDSTSCESGQ